MAKGLGLLLVLGGVGAAAVWSLAGEPIPEPLVTADVLPPLPDAQTNGWTQLRSLPETFEFGFVEDSGSPIYQLSDRDRLSQRERWDALVEGRKLLAATLEQPSVKRALEVWHRASEAPTFADACPSLRLKSCQEFRYFQLHQVALAEVAVDAMTERWELAGQRLAQAIQMDLRFLVSSRSLLAASVAAACLNDSLGLADVLANEGQWEDAPELWAVIRTLEQTTALEYAAAYEQAIAGEYLIGRAYLRHIESEGTETLTGESRWPPSFAFDEGHTARLIDTTYARLSSRELEGFEAADCDGLAGVTNALGCAHFGTDVATRMRLSGLQGLDTSLSGAAGSLAQLAKRLGPAEK